MPVIESTKAQTVAVPQILDEACRACRKCAARRVCRTKAILQIDPGEPPFIDSHRCYGCLLCIPACPHGAIIRDGSQNPAVSTPD